MTTLTKRISLLVMTSIGTIAIMAMARDLERVRTAPADQPSPSPATNQPAAMGGSPCGSSGGFYFNAATFDDHRAQLGLVQIAAWSFSPHALGPSTAVLLSDPLNASTHGSNANDPWAGGLWPSSLNNVQFSSNMTPNGPLTPRGANGLTFGSAGFFGTHAALAPTNVLDSLSIQCESPNAGKVQAMAIELASSAQVRIFFAGDDSSATQSIDVSINVAVGQKVFVAFIRTRIQRIDIWNMSGGVEQLASIAIYRRPTPDCGDNNGIVGVPDLLAVINQWGQVGTPCDKDGNGIGVPDLLAVINAWGPVAPTECVGPSPSLEICTSNDDCFPGICSQVGCTPSSCICDGGIWICTDDCCGHCS